MATSEKPPLDMFLAENTDRPRMRKDITRDICPVSMIHNRYLQFTSDGTRSICPLLVLYLPCHLGLHTGKTMLSNNQMIQELNIKDTCRREAFERKCFILSLGFGKPT